MDGHLLATTTAFSLAAAAGLNTTLPLLLAGLLARSGQLTLVAPYDALATTPVLGAVALVSVLEFLGDKLPVADTLVHTLQWPAAGPAGAVLFASQTAAVAEPVSTGPDGAGILLTISWPTPPLALVAGLLTALAVYGARTMLRPLVTISTFGLGTVVVSAAEDVYALLLVSAAVLLPTLGLVLVVLLAAAVAGTLLIALRLRRALHLHR